MKTESERSQITWLKKSYTIHPSFSKYGMFNMYQVIDNEDVETNYKTCSQRIKSKGGDILVNKTNKSLWYSYY